MSTGDDPHIKDCPLRAVHQRLEDLHRQWHQAEQAYFDPDAFRVAIQTSIQTSRTVTFILQRNRRVIPQFDEWYSDWQKVFAGNPLMRWMVDARNRIEKEGDLEANSYVRAEIVASYLDEGPSIEVPANLFDAPLKLLKSIPDSEMGKHIKRDGVLRIQRKWIENTLPEWELLEAVATTYGLLSDIVADAHRQMGMKQPRTTNIKTGEIYDGVSMKGRLPCMIGHSDLRTLNIWLADGTPVDFEMIEKPIDLRKAEKTIERYNIKPEEVFGNSRDVERVQESLFSTASKMFLRDGHHVTIMFLFREGSLARTVLMEPQEHGEKYMLMRKLAQEVAKKGVDAAILVGEVWVSPFDARNPFQRAEESPDRKEALHATLVRKEGPPRELSSEINRTGNKIGLGETIEHLDGAHFMFAPFYSAWGRAIPDAWAAAVRDAGNKPD